MVYCWGPGANGSTKSGMRLNGTRIFVAKEVIGGVEYCERKRAVEERWPRRESTGMSGGDYSKAEPRGR